MPFIKQRHLIERTAALPACGGILSGSIAIHGTCDARFSRVRELIRLSLILSENVYRYARLSANPRDFGHTGAGDWLGMADPAAGIGFGFTPNRMHGGRVSAGTTAVSIIEAFYEALGATPTC